jgi:hypothetical protein
MSRPFTLRASRAPWRVPAGVGSAMSAERMGGLAWCGPDELTRYSHLSA